MAERRMIAKKIVDSDVFLDMPATTQNLYFHLNIRADDEGFINNPKMIMRSVGANQNDLDLLLAKRYLLSFESGVIVIKHWKMHNLIRKDRLTETLYQEEKSTLFEKDNGAYTDHKPIEVKQLPNDNQATTGRQPDDANCRHRLGKDSIDKVSKVDTDFDTFYNAYPRHDGKAQALKTWEKLSKKKILPEISVLLVFIEKWKQSKSFPREKQYIPMPSTWLNGERWNDELKESVSATVEKPIQCKKCGNYFKGTKCPYCGEDV